MDNDPTIDIVVIGKNEGPLLDTALSSVTKAAEEYCSHGYAPPRLIYVDGQSNDSSVELAMNMGFETYVVEGKPNPAAGRHLGFSKCSSKYVFFVDGDMELYKGWLPKAVLYLESNQEIAGVSGILDCEYLKGELVIRRKENFFRVRVDGEKVRDDVGGAFIYRRHVLLQIGDFDPSMPRVEEMELYLRLLATGYSLARITIPMAVHRNNKVAQVIPFIKRHLFNRNILIQGVVARKAPFSWSVYRFLLGVYWLYLAHCASVAFLLLCAIRTIFLRTVAWLPCGALVIALLVWAHYMWRRRDLRRALVSLLTVNFYALGFILGFVLGRPKVGGFYAKQVRYRSRDDRL